MKRMDSASMRIWYELCIHKLYQTSCRLREVLCYIRWLLFCISRYCVTLRKCCLTVVDNFFISRKILKIEYSSCQNVTLSVQMTSICIWHYIFTYPPSTQILIFSLYNKISSFPKMNYHPWDCTFVRFRLILALFECLQNLKPRELRESVSTSWNKEGQIYNIPGNERKRRDEILPPTPWVCR